MQDILKSWLSLDKTERQKYINELLAGQSQIDYIDLVEAGKLGVYASLGTHFDYAIFGRDSIQVAEDLLSTHKSLAHRIIMTLASLQGVKTDAKSEEEPGKIHHEYRSLIFNDVHIPETSVNIMRRLQQVWGDETSDNLRYYGSYDATPLYIRLVSYYVKVYGSGILKEIYEGLDGHRSIADSLEKALGWLTNKIESSPWQLLEYRRMNRENGITNQAWKDSGTSYLHLDGQLANYDGGIASIELQGYAYDALKAGANLIAKNDQQKNDWLELANQVSLNTIDKLWMPEQKFFAQGLDRGPDGLTRQIQTTTSNPGLLLDSDLLLDLAAAEKEKYVETIIKKLSSSDFMTAVGIRSRSLLHKDMPGFIDYHGSYTVWPKETYGLARGLQHHGKSKLAQQMQSLILSAVMRAGEFYEFFYVNDDGQVWYDKEEAIAHFRELGKGENMATPENGQAWTISAVESILSKLQ